MAKHDVAEFVDEARTAGVATNPERHGVRFTPDKSNIDVDSYYIYDDEGSFDGADHFGPSGQYLGTVTTKALRDALGLD